MSEWVTTLSEIRKHNPCGPSWNRLLASLGKTKADDTEVSIEYILDLLGVEDTQWAMRAVDLSDEMKRELRLLACAYAEHVLPIYESKHPNDKRPRKAIEAARQHAYGEIGESQLNAARDAMKSATWDDAGVAVWVATRAAVGVAAESATWAVKAAAEYAARDAEQAWQEEQLRKMIGGRGMIKAEIGPDIPELTQDQKIALRFHLQQISIGPPASFHEFGRIGSKKAIQQAVKLIMEAPEPTPQTARAAAKNQERQWQEEQLRKSDESRPSIPTADKR